MSEFENQLISILNNVGYVYFYRKETPIKKEFLGIDLYFIKELFLLNYGYSVPMSGFSLNLNVPIGKSFVTGYLKYSKFSINSYLTSGFIERKSIFFNIFEDFVKEILPILEKYMLNEVYYLKISRFAKTSTYMFEIKVSRELGEVFRRRYANEVLHKFYILVDKWRKEFNAEVEIESVAVTSEGMRMKIQFMFDKNIVETLEIYFHPPTKLYHSFPEMTFEYFEKIFKLAITEKTFMKHLIYGLLQEVATIS